MAGIFDHPPSFYEDQAREHETRGEWLEAAEAWGRARTVSAGHGRRERYQNAAERCKAEYAKSTGRKP